MDTNQHQHNEGDVPAGDLLVGADAIRAFLVHLGLPDDVDVYYERRAGRWPIGKHGASLIASKRRLSRHAQKITAPKNTAA